MLVKINLEDVLEFVEDGKDCKVEVSADGQAYVLDQEATGYDDTILTQNLEAYDYEECESVEGYTEWLEDCYQEELEAEDGKLVKLEFVK